MTRYESAKEIVRNDALESVFIATDYFDASINRISAWVTGLRNIVEYCIAGAEKFCSGDNKIDLKEI